ncbi:MAG: hypothetical protein VXZ15_05735 [Planctomycetota bacterium]|nr:hypothetical protein [Planctomycetota bacterium]
MGASSQQKRERMGEAGELFSSLGTHVSQFHESRVVEVDREYPGQVNCRQAYLIEE